MTETNRRQADARRVETHAVAAIDGSQRCSALTCAMRAHEAADYRGLVKPLCRSHSRQYVEWGARDRERMAEVLWHWETPGEASRIGGVQVAWADELPARGRTAGIRQASAHTGGRRNRSIGE